MIWTGTAHEIATSRAGTPVVLCGRNRRLLRQFTANRSVIALSWIDVPLLLTAAACVVQNDGGMMSLEALAAGVPVVTYRCIAGHGETNASVLDRAGLVPWIRSYAHLGDGIAKAIAPTRRPDLWSATRAIRPSIVQAVLSPPCVWTRVGFRAGQEITAQRTISGCLIISSRHF